LSRMTAVLRMVLCLFAVGPACLGAGVVWLEAEERHGEGQGTVMLIDSTTDDYGRMARTEASGERFLRLGPKAAVPLAPVAVAEPGTHAVWVRAFPLTGRWATVVVDGTAVGTTSGDVSARLVWQRVGNVTLTAGRHELTLTAAEGNARFAYVDAVALLADLQAAPAGRSASDIVSGGAVRRIVEEFGATEAGRAWLIVAPPGADAAVGALAGEDNGALHIHNGTGKSYSLTSREYLDVAPGDQVTVRVRARKGRLMERLSIELIGIGVFSPQVYRRYETVERTWIVPTGVAGCVRVRLTGRGGGDTYITRIEAFRREQPLSPFVTGRFLPRPNLHREGRLFEIERYVVNRAAFSTDTDIDGDGRWSLCRLSREDNSPYFSRGTVLKSDTVEVERYSPTDGCAPLHVQVGPLEPGPYQVCLNVPGRALAFSTDGNSWRRLPGGKASTIGVVEITERTFEFWLDDRYLEPGNPGPTYVDFIRFMPTENPAYTMASIEEPQPPKEGSVDRVEVTLTVRNASKRARSEPVRSGVPVPQGQLRGPADVRLVDEDGRALGAAIQCTGRWPDGSVKWLLVDTDVNVPARSDRQLVLTYGNSVKHVPVEERIHAKESETNVVVDTGRERIVFDRRRGDQFDVYRGDDTAPFISVAGLTFEAADGRVWTSGACGQTDVVLEELGPSRVAVRLRGLTTDDDGPGPFAFDCRVHLFAGRSEALLEPAFFATTREPTVDVVSVTLRVSSRSSTIQFGAENDSLPRVPSSEAPRLLQTGDTVHGGGGRFPFTVKTADELTVASGERAPGWVRLERGSDQPATLVCVPHFWEQFPKGLACDSRGVTVELWAKTPGAVPFTAHAGAGKSHRIGLSWGTDVYPERWLEPLFAQCTPAWYCRLGVFEELVPRVNGIVDDYEAVVDAGFEEMLVTKCGYGMENWGDVWQHGYVPKARTWSNQEWDLVNNWVIPFVRTGDRRFLTFAHEAARHYADVDCIHYATNPAVLGAAWMHCHTSLEGHQLESPNFAHSGWVEGMLNVYHLTGDRRGLEASRGIAQYIVRHAKAAETLPAHGPPYRLVIQRSAGWPLTTLSLVYRETWEPEILQAARRIVDYARRCQDPERGAWDAQVGHEAPYRGGCIFAYTLLRGLRLYGDITGEERARSDYLAAARWLTTELWRPGHRYLYEQCPVHEAGSALPFLLGAMGGYATRLSGDLTYATIAWDALGQYSQGGAGSRMVRDAARCQWGNGVLQQLPRMIYDWQQAGYRLENGVRFSALDSPNRVPVQRASIVQAVLANDTDRPLQKVRLSVLVRGDWVADVQAGPSEVAPGASAPVEIACQAPSPLAQYELQNDMAHAHLLARFVRDGEQCVALGHIRLDVARPLEVLSLPASVALKAGETVPLVLDVVDGIDASPTVRVTGSTDVGGVSVGRSVVTPGRAGRCSVVLPVTAERTCKSGSGVLKLAVRSGPRQTGLELPLMVGRFRAVLIESGGGEEWKHPFERLRTYPGIAVAFMSGAEVRSQFPTTAAGISQRWETVVIGDTGVGAAAFSEEQLKALADFVRRGGGLMLIGGARCYTPGGYADTVVKGLLPVDLADGAYVLGPMGVEVLTPEAAFFEGYDARLPDFGAHNRLGTKPEARVLARFSDGSPFIALGEAGEGRVLCLGAIWNHGSGRAFRQWPNYGRLIGRCVRWTAGDLAY
jgi:uncharacterized membrane protein